MKLLSAIVSICSTTFTLTAHGHPLDQPVLPRNNGCGRNENRIDIARFNYSMCENTPCTVTQEAKLVDVVFRGCGNAVCSDVTLQLQNKRSGGHATYPQGGQGTCMLAYASVSTFECPNNSKIVVTIDSTGVPSFYSLPNQSGKAALAWFDSRISHTGCHYPTTKDQSTIPYDMVYIDCSGVRARCV